MQPACKFHCLSETRRFCQQLDLRIVLKNADNRVPHDFTVVSQEEAYHIKLSYELGDCCIRLTASLYQKCSHSTHMLDTMSLLICRIDYEGRGIVPIRQAQQNTWSYVYHSDCLTRTFNRRVIRTAGDA